MTEGTNLDLPFSYPHQHRFLFGDESEGNNPWNKYDWDALFKISHATGFLSFLGSGWIIARVLCDAKRRGQVYHRIMLALSTFDFFLSFWMFMGRWAQPAPDFDGCDECHGNTETCEASGFFIMLGFLAIPLYNVVLSVYYYLVICKNWKDQDFLKHSLEKCVHFIIPTISFIYAIIPLPLDLYNSYQSFCSAVAMGYDYESDTYARGTLRGTRAYVFMNLCVVGLCTLCVTGIMIRIYLRVRHTEKRSSAYGENFTQQPQRSSVQRQLTKNRRSSNTRKRSNAVAIRALLYTLPFYCTWIIPTIWLTMGHFCFTGLGPSACLEPRPTYVLQVWTNTFLPLQGFFNAIIYDVVPYLQKKWVKNSQNNSEAITEEASSTRCSAVLPDPIKEYSSQLFVSLKEKVSQSFMISKSFSTSDKSSDKSSCNDHHDESHLNMNEEDLSENKIIDLVSNNPQDSDDILSNNEDGQEITTGEGCV